TGKNVFVWQGGGYARKGVEAWFTFLIEHLWGKQRIMEVYLNVGETGIGTYGVNAGSERYYGHDASAMSPVEAARVAAVLPLPKKRGAVAPKGFTRRYGNTIAARIGIVARDDLDSCIYKGIAAPVNKAPPPVARKPRPLPQPFPSAIHSEEDSMATRTQSRSSSRNSESEGRSRSGNGRSAFSWGESAGPLLAAGLAGAAIGIAANYGRKALMQGLEAQA